MIGEYCAADDATGNKEIWSDYPKESETLPTDFDGIHSFGFCWGRLFKRAPINDILDKN